MSASLHQLSKKTYFTWADKLWYVVDVAKDGDMVFVEDCKTEKVRWIKIELFKEDMRVIEVEQDEENERLASVNELRDQGIISDDEFNAELAKLSEGGENARDSDS
jgi:molybdopterin-guanine dinucleotide biosynthesis protein